MCSTPKENLEVRIFSNVADYGLALNLKEEQNVRGPLLDSSFYRLSANWCSRTQEIFDIKYGFCLGLSEKHSSASSEIESNLSFREKLTVQTRETQLQLLLRFGDDFYL